VAELGQRYLDEYAVPHKKPSGIAQDRRNLQNHVVPLIGNLRVRAVERADVARIMREVATGKTAKDEKTKRQGRRIVRGGEIVANRVRLVRDLFDECFSPSWIHRGYRRHPVARRPRISPPALGGHFHTVARVSSLLVIPEQEPECARCCGIAALWSSELPLRKQNQRTSAGTQLFMESETLNKAIVCRWFASFWGDSCNLAIVDELAAPSVVLQYSMHNPRRGQRAVKHFMADFREAFPNLCFRRIGALIADRDIVVVRWEGDGTHSGPAFHDFNIDPLPPASGLNIVLSGHTAIRLEDNMIAEEAVWSTERKAQLRPIMGGLVLGLSTSELAST
jgi:hypothetical protein